MTASPTVLHLTRDFAAPPEAVYAAWSSAERMARWFAPEGCSVPAARVEFHPGGVLELTMAVRGGRTHVMRGHFTALEPARRIDFTVEVDDGAGHAMFRAITAITLVAHGSGTRLAVEQRYELLDPDAARLVEGAPAGWASTLDQLGREAMRAGAAYGAVHDQFTLTRLLDASPARVFAAFTEPEAKALWFGGGSTCTLLDRQMDVRPGGTEHLSGRWDDGTVTCFEARYLDVIADARLIYSYEMHIDGRKISVSLATIGFAPEGGGTRLTVTEQGVFLDGYEDRGARAHGTGILLDRLGAVLAGSAVPDLARGAPEA
ncbi:MAG: SRPBCC domain-containing protein [Rhodospirillales bacterium]|nr:SRPBCC domain-containing protein [Rhodospirillales bacterium]